MGKAAREKGARGERELASKLRELGFEHSRRGYQWLGALTEADIESALPGIHIECKRTNRFLSRFMFQAMNDAPDGLIPVVMWRRDHGEWIAVQFTSDFIGMDAFDLSVMEPVLKTSRDTIPDALALARSMMEVALYPATYWWIDTNTEVVAMPLADWIEIYKESGLIEKGENK
ncbi:MAG: hypothetical protein FWD45_00150 [Coriobacteriia bacterium]|nr:hypothetical protein [Coriobacteriia bacterium]